jgi:VRR-NUC domain
MRWSEQDYLDYLKRQGIPLTPAHTTPSTTLPDDTPEGSLLARVRRLATENGWLTFHTYDSRRSEYGFPDLVCTDGTAVLMYELKTNTGKLTPEQQRWLSLLEHTGKVECGVWRPRDWPQISARLTRKEPHHA